MDLSPTSWKPMCMGLRSLQLWSKSPEQSCTMCSTEMLKQTLFFLSRKHGTGPQRGQTLTKGLAGTSPAALHTYWSWILKKVTHQETGRAELLWGEEKLGNEGNMREVLYCLNKTGLAVEMSPLRVSDKVRKIVKCRILPGNPSGRWGWKWVCDTDLMFTQGRR